MPLPLDPEKRTEARALREQGLSLTEIAQALDISYGSAHRFTRGVCPEKERAPETRAKIAGAKEAAHDEWTRAAPRGGCGTAGCKRADCAIEYGRCHCGCGEAARLAADDNRPRAYVRGEPRLYVQGHQRGGDTLMAAGNGEPLLGALELAGLSRIEVTRRAKLGKGVVADLIGLEGYRLRRVHCEQILSVLRAEFERQGLDPSDVTLGRLFTEDRPEDEPPVGERARRVKRQRPPIPPDERGDGRHFKEAREKATTELDGKGWTREQAAAFLMRVPSIVNRRVEQDRLLEPVTVKIGPLRYKLFDPTAVKRLALAEQTSEEKWSRNMRDPDFVFASTLIRTGDRRQAAEAKRRTEERNRLHQRIRVGTGRSKAPGPPAHHYEWQALFVGKQDELVDEYQMKERLDLLVEGERPPTELDIALAVAEDPRGLCHLPPHYHTPGGSLRVELADEASRTIRNAVKRLQNAGTETRAA
jgi:hypothetical protein